MKFEKNKVKEGLMMKYMTVIVGGGKKDKSLKKWEIELNKKAAVAEYCDNDVITTEEVWIMTQHMPYRRNEVWIKSREEGTEERHY